MLIRKTEVKEGQQGAMQSFMREESFSERPFSSGLNPPPLVEDLKKVLPLRREMKWVWLFLQPPKI